MQHVVFDRFNRRRDFELCEAGYLDAYLESYPAMPITSALRDEVRAAAGALECTEHTLALTALVSDEPIAFAVASLNTFFGVLMGSIDSFYVAPSHRRQGVGKALMEKSIAWCKSRGARFVQLDVSADNEAALRLYEASAFVITRHRMARQVD